MVLSALENGSDAFIEHMFRDAGLLAWLTDAPRSVVPRAREGDAGAAERPASRAGCAVWPRELVIT